jgi:DNA-binding transcriptional regulator YiaG
MMFEYKEKITIKSRFCPECMSDNVKPNHVLHQLEIKDGWAQVSFFLPVITCGDCQATSDALEAKDAVHDASCIAMGVLPPREIKRIRKEMGFSNAVDFAKFLGVGESTVKRWEARISFPDKNQMKLINIAKIVGVENFKNFASLQSLFEGGSIKVKREGAEVVELDTRRTKKATFSHSYGSASDEDRKKLEAKEAVMTSIMSVRR